MAYGQTNVNEQARGGEFLTGNLNFVTVATTVPAYPTNVKAPLAQALKARNWPNLLAGTREITVVDAFGASTTYNTNAGYTDAYNTQQNLTTIVTTFANRANPVIVSVSSAVVADGSGPTILANAVNSDTFGSAFNGSQTVYTIKFVTEVSPSYLVSSAMANTNELGYQLLDVMQGVPVLATTAVSVSYIETGSGDNDRNTIATISNFL
jgi:hypothetical protein